MDQKKNILTCFLIVILLSLALPVQAGFGISPPYVKSLKPIFPGSRYEQKITLLRSSAEDILQAEVVVNAPDIAPWITIDKGNKFDLPAGELQVPMIVRVDVPADAELGNYKGNINVRIAPKEAGSSGVAIALGARIDIDLTVDKQSFSDFLVRTIAIPDMESLKQPWSWPLFSYFFHKIEVVLKIENLGNVKVAPSRVKLELYDIGEKSLLEEREDTSLKKVEPYKTEDVTASFRTKLPPGQYWGKVKVYKENEIVKNDKLAFTIYEPGKSPNGARPLGPWPYVMMGTIILFLLAVIGVLIKYRSWRALFKLLYIIIWPLLYIGGKLNILRKLFMIKFWQWLHRKSAKYQNLEYKEEKENSVNKKE